MHNNDPRALSPEPPNCIGEAAHDIVCGRAFWIGHRFVGTDDKCIALHEASSRGRKDAAVAVSKAHLATLGWPDTSQHCARAEGQSSVDRIRVSREEGARDSRHGSCIDLTQALQRLRMPFREPQESA